MKIRSVIHICKLAANRQTDKQIDKCRVKHKRVGVGKQNKKTTVKCS